MKVQRFIYPFLLFLLAAAFPLQGQESQTGKKPSFSLMDPIPVNPAVRMGKLENGMVYYILVNRKPEKRMELRLAVNAGSVLETDAQQGLAHFVEHMAFNGSEHFAKNELVRFLESIGTRFGADLNAYTAFDETVYMLQIPTDNEELMDKGFLVLSDWASGLSFEPEEIDKERGVIIEEMRGRRGASWRILQKQYPVMFRGSKYAERLPIGKEEILRTFPHDTLREFYRRWYRPDNMAVVAVGDFDADAVEKKIRETFSRIPRPSAPLDRPTVPVPDHRETLTSIVTDPEATGNSVQVLVKFDAREKKKIRDYRRAMIEDLYETMFNARLSELLQKPNPPFINAGVGFWRLGRTKDVLGARAQVENNGIERGLEAVFIEQERVRRHGFTETELERAKTDLLRQMEQEYNERDKQESDGLAYEFVAHFLSGDPAPGVELAYRLYEKYLPTVMLKEVNEVATSVPAEGNRVILASLPQKKDVRVPKEKDLLSVFERVSKMAIEPYVDEVANKPLAEVPPSNVRVASTREIRELGVIEWTLSNGIRVVLKPTDFKNDEVLFAALSPGGSSLVPQEDALSADMADNIIDQSGLGDFDAVKLRKALTGKVVSISPQIGELEEGFSGNAAPKDIETLLQLLYLYFTHPREDTAVFQSYKKRMKAMLENMGSMPEKVFSDTLSVTLAQYHPRRRPMTAERLEELNLPAVMRVYRDRYADAGDFTFLFVGNIAPDTFKPLVERYLGALPCTGRKEMWKDLGVRMPESAVEKTVRKGIEKKSMVVLVFNGPMEGTLENRYALSSLEELLTIRLRESVREEKGGTYGVGVQVNITRRPIEQYVAVVNFGCDPDRVDELVSTALAELRKAVDSNATEEEIQKIREIQRREHEKNLKENGWWLNRLRSAYSNGDDPLEILAFERLVSSLSPDMLRETAARVFHFDRMKKFVLYPEETGGK
ncbi:MAG: insulinase family protein [Bacteroidota bacterium]|nr:insulinase family protein [Bacteroidota bacterium]